MLQLGDAERAGAVRDRRQGAVGGSRRTPRAGHGDPHARLSAAAGGVRRQLALRHARRAHLHRLRRRARLQGPAARSVFGLSALQAASVHLRHPLRRPGGPLRRQGAARGRLEHAAAPVHGRWPDRRRRRELRELDAPEGHSPGDAQRHAGGRDRVRRAAGRRHVGARALSLQDPGGRQRDQGGALSGARRPSGVRGRALCGQHVRGAGDADRGTAARGPGRTRRATPG